MPLSNADNLVIHIVLPKGLALTDGSFLDTDVTFDVVGALTPFYASIDQVRLEGGVVIRKLPDITVAAMIYSSSQEADQFCSTPPVLGTAQYDRFAYARNAWVVANAAYSLLVNLANTGRQSHVLANFSVTKEVNLEEKLKDLRETIAKYEVVLKSCGNAVPGSRPRPVMAAKGVNDGFEPTPGRTWVTTGPGVNSTSHAYSSTGGRGKTYKFYSPPVIGYRVGIFSSGYIVTLG